MRIISTLLMLFFALQIQAQFEPEKNKAQLYKGTADQKYEDSRIYFEFTGKVKKLIENMGKAHRVEMQEAGEMDGKMRYKGIRLPYPNWVYGNLNVYVEVDESGKKPVVTIYHTYYNKNTNITGTTLGNAIEVDMLKFYQRIINDSK